MAVTIRGLSTLVKTMTKLCQVIAVFGPSIRVYVPVSNRAAYDAALTAITEACEVIRNIDYLLDGIGTNT